MNKDRILKWLENEKQTNRNSLDKTELGSFARVGFAERIYIIQKTIEYINQEEFIQSEPEEKTVFDEITESPERLANYFYDVNKLYAESLGFNVIQSKEDGVAEFIKWLNEKAGE